MEKNKLGFTLMELLGVIIILGLLMILVFPSIINSVKNSTNDVDQVTEQLVSDAVNLYISDSYGYYDSINGAQFCISLTDLIDENYLKSPIKYNNLNDITNTHSVKVTYNNGYNYKLVENNKCPAVICKRAIELHTAECEYTAATSNNCYVAGYYANGSKGTTTITYGSLGTTGQLSSGDAFDCDVNADGEYDEETERFYYITDLDESKNYAVLLYYNNTTLGEPDATAAAATDYYTENSHNGPLTAIKNLPTATQWNNIKLFNYIRPITTEKGESTPVYNGGSLTVNLPTAFSYSNYSARLLTYSEASTALNGGRLNDVNNLYLIENTLFENSEGHYAYWLENVHSQTSTGVWTIHSGPMSFYMDSYNSTQIGARPVIEVPKYRIEY